MAITRILASLLFLVISGTSFGQASLVLKNQDGKVIGWLMQKSEENSELFQYLTPDGFILTLDRYGRTAMPPVNVPTYLWYETTDCTGQAYVSPYRVGEGQIYQLNHDHLSDVFVADSLNDTQTYTANISSVKYVDGVCEEIPPASELTRKVAEIDPTDYGLLKVGDIWRVPGPTYGVAQSDLIFCNGYESCPQQ